MPIEPPKGFKKVYVIYGSGGMEMLLVDELNIAERALEGLKRSFIAHNPGKEPPFYMVSEMRREDC